MAHYIVKTRPGCASSAAAIRLLKQVGASYTEQSHNTDASRDAFIHNGFKTFPQVFRDGVHIGGYMELAARLNAGR